MTDTQKAIKYLLSLTDCVRYYDDVSTEDKQKIAESRTILQELKTIIDKYEL